MVAFAHSASIIRWYRIENVNESAFSFFDWTLLTKVTERESTNFADARG